MFKAARNDYRVYPYKKSRGIALLIMLSLILVAFTTIAISRLSINSGEQKARAKTTQALIQSRDAIMAYALARDADTQSPGTLPCPDTDGDGISNPAPPSVAPCTGQRGLVPFITLGIQQPFDGSGAPIWYVVSMQYSGAPGGSTTPHNSTKSSFLRLNTQPVAFVLIAPGEALSGQNRPSLLPYKNPPYGSFANFLEGDNADTTLDSYSDFTDDTHNDRVLAVSVTNFWAEVEGRVLSEVKEKLTTYYSKCSSKLPGAVTPFGKSGDAGTASILEGGLPFDLVTQCSPGPTTAFSTWLTINWPQILYYAFCASGNSGCIHLRDINNLPLQDVSAIVIAPGTPLSTTTPSQIPRTTGQINLYFELENASVGNNIFTQAKTSSYTSKFNDRIIIIR